MKLVLKITSSLILAIFVACLLYSTKFSKATNEIEYNYVIEYYNAAPPANWKTFKFSELNNIIVEATNKCLADNCKDKTSVATYTIIDDNIEIFKNLLNMYEDNSEEITEEHILQFYSGFIIKFNNKTIAYIEEDNASVAYEQLKYILIFNRPYDK